MTWPSNDSDSRRGKPDSGWRTTITRTPIARRVIAVSAMVSPLPSDDAPGANEITSAPTRCSASVNDVAVRVLASKNKLRTGTPASRSRGGTAALNAVARSSRSISSDGETSSTSIKLRGGTFLVDDQRDGVLLRTLRREYHVDVLAATRRDQLSDVIGLDRQLTQAAVDQDGQPNDPRAAEVGDGIECRAHGAPREENVIDDHDGFARDLAK